MSVQNSHSESDLSSNSSWTILNPSSQSDLSENLHLVKQDVNDEQTTKRLLELQIEEDAGVLEQGALKTEGKNKKPNKNVCDYNMLSILACLLTIAGMTLLTTVLPLNYTEPTDLSAFHNHLAEVYENSQHPTFESAASSIQFTKDLVEKAQSLNLFDEASQNLSDDTCEAFFPELVNSTFSPEDYTELKVRVVAPYYEEMPKETRKLFTIGGMAGKLQNGTKTLYESAKDLVQNRSLQMFVATLVQDLCLIKLISDFTKRHAPVERLEKKKRPKKTSLKKKSLPKELQVATSSIPADKSSENGKSECERRFEELDTRWSQLGQNHRERIQQIKDTFQKEIDEIKQQETEGINRKQKIRLTREKFIQKLKADREVYLHRLRILRDERQESLHEMCQGFKKYRNLSPKDVSVGNFAVVLPDEYDFSKKLEDIQSKALKVETQRVQLQATNNETVSYVPPVTDQGPVVPIFKEEEFPPLTGSSRKGSGRARLLKKRLAKNSNKDVKEIAAVDNSESSINEDGLKEPPPTPKEDQKEAAQQSFTENNGSTDDGNSTKSVVKKKGKKRNINKLYDAAFENGSMKIRKQDLIKWRRHADEYRNVAQQEVFTKQDPQKVYQQKIIHKGIL